MKEKAYQVLKRFVMRHFPDSVSERKEVLAALQEITPEQEITHDQIGSSLTALEIHENHCRKLDN